MPVMVVRVVLICSYHSLVSCLVKALGLYCPLVLLSLLLKYEMSMFSLEIKEGRSRQNNMKNTMPVKD